MEAQKNKYDLILDSLQKLLENRKLQTISVSEIAQTAGIGKGSRAERTSPSRQNPTMRAN